MFFCFTTPMSSKKFSDGYFMSLYNLFFFISLGFVIGTVLCGLGVPVFFVFLCCFGGMFLNWKKGVLFVLPFVAIFVGSFYYVVDDYFYVSARNEVVILEEFYGMVEDVPSFKGDRQSFRVSLDERIGGGRVLVYTYSPIEFSYGDVVFVKGEIRPPPHDSYGKYLVKERIHGVAFYPEIDFIEKDESFRLKFLLYDLRGSIKTAIFSTFTHKRAAFLNGVLLGDRDEFSPDFLEKLSLSGTMHLTALSGLHMTIIIFMALSFFSVVFFGKRRPVFIAVFVFVFLFVAMTGFKVSALRASFMAFISGLAKQTDRVYNPRNAIVFVALIITLLNPKIPVSDVAFHLSFSATLSIIYLAPVIRRFAFFTKESFLSWRDILSITISAQLGVAPLTVLNFGNFSLSSLPANIAILVVMPLLITAGGITVVLSFIFEPLAVLVGKFVSFLLDYSIAVVEFFYRFRVPFNPEIGWGSVILYYVFLIGSCFIFVFWGRFEKFKKILEKF